MIVSAIIMSLIYYTVAFLICNALSINYIAFIGVSTLIYAIIFAILVARENVL